jgi:hypothetical protein
MKADNAGPLKRELLCGLHARSRCHDSSQSFPRSFTVLHNFVRRPAQISERMSDAQEWRLPISRTSIIPLALLATEHGNGAWRIHNLEGNSIPMVVLGILS